MLYFTSDTHFQHINIIKHCSRPFNGVDDMDSVLLERWNSAVRPQDTVYHLGDFGWFRRDTVKALCSIFNKLNGQKILVRGNHDHKGTDKLPWAHCCDYYEFKHENCKYVLFHYPIEEWSACHHGSIHLHGHTHGDELSTEYRRMNVSADAHDFYPVSVARVTEVMDKKIIKRHH